MSTPSNHSNHHDHVDDDRSSPILEDGPRMRSVAMIASMPAPSLLSIPRPEAMKVAPVVHVATTVSSQSSNNAPCWKLLVPLEVVPEYYQLERTHVSVDASPQLVATRIAECLREASITAIISDSEACLDAETSDHVEFCVHLWADEQTKTSQVIVEIQRVAGCCYLFCQTAKMILRAAQGEAIPASPASHFTIPKSIPRLSEQEEEKCCDEGLGIAQSLLANQRLDGREMALESLIQLTNTASSCRAYAARSIISGTMLDNIVALMEHSSSASIVSDEIEQEHSNLMHRYALTLFANCMETLSATKELAPLMQKHTDVFQSQALLLALVNDVSSCSKAPHDAFQALKCLQIMTTACSSTKSYILDFGASRAIQIAQKEGLCRHANLYHESQKLWIEMRQHHF